MQHLEKKTNNRFYLRKNNKLKSNKVISLLYKNGKSVKNFPIKAIYLPYEDFDFSPFLKETQVGFSAPKRIFKNAVDRNRIKRQMREIYRLNQFSLRPKVALFFIYVSHKHLSYKDIEKSMLACIDDINNAME